MKVAELPVASLRFGFQQIPEEGLEFRFEESFESLWREQILEPSVREELHARLKAPILGNVQIRKVGAKVDCRGEFSTRVTGPCDRCLEPMETRISGDLSHFLMPQAQFSKHDKPGGKVIHRPRRERELSRHRSRSKDEDDLTDAPEDHEDLAFGAFDGVTVDLEAYLREVLLLHFPVKWLCRPDCRGLCLVCGGNLNWQACKPGCESQAVEWG